MGLSDKPEAKEKAKDYGKEVKKELKGWLELLEPSEKAPLGEVLYGDKGRLGRETLLAFPRLIKIYLQLMVDTSDYITDMAPEEWERFRASYLASLDDLPLGDAVNSYFRLSRKLWEDDSEALVEAELKLAGETISQVDFGKIRKAMEVKLEGHYPVWEGILGQMVGDPIIIANLLTAVPAFANTLLRLLNSTLGKVDLPAEILASATFNVLEELDVEEFGRLVSTIAGMIISMHEGDLVLGHNQRRLHEVASRLIERYLSAADYRTNHAAIVAVCESLEVLVSAFADAVTARPEALEDGVSCFSQAAGALIRGASHFARRMEEMPDTFYGEYGNIVREQFEHRELGSLFNSMLKINNRVLEASPGITADVLDRFYTSVDPEELKNAVRENLRQLFGWLAGQKDLLDWLEPGEAGKMLNSLLTAYNRSPAASGAVRDYASSMLEQVEAPELERAVKAVTSQLVEAVAVRPEIMRALARAVWGMTWKMVKGYLQSFRSRRER